MEVHFTPEREAQLSKIATNAGADAEQVVKNTVSRMLEHQARCLEAVERGIASADRGDFLEHDEVVERMDRLFPS